MSRKRTPAPAGLVTLSCQVPETVAQEFDQAIKREGLSRYAALGRLAAMYADGRHGIALRRAVRERPVVKGDSQPARKEEFIAEILPDEHGNANVRRKGGEGHVSAE